MSASEKVLEPEQLLEALKAHREAGRRIVTTNGCFDVLHVGHLRYLQGARQAGDHLVVLLNADDSVRCIKGTNRPIIPEGERAEMLAGLSCVDYVTLFHEETPLNVLKQIRPDVHVKGADYSAETLPEAEVLSAMGTEMVFMPMVQGRSTTNLIQRILQVYQPSDATA